MPTASQVHDPGAKWWHAHPMIVAASWTANFSSWPHFANWLNNSNIASLFMGIVLPVSLLVLWHLRATRRFHDRTIAELKAHIDKRLESAHDGEAPST
jgi:hypothetical protein